MEVCRERMRNQKVRNEYHIITRWRNWTSVSAVIHVAPTWSIFYHCEPAHVTSAYYSLRPISFQSFLSTLNCLDSFSTATSLEERNTKHQGQGAATKPSVPTLQRRIPEETLTLRHPATTPAVRSYGQVCKQKKVFPGWYLNLTV